MTAPTYLQLLFVDDDEALRSSFARRFRQLGHSVVEAANGEEGWQVLQTKPIQVAVLDVRMPVMTGLELLQRIREQEMDCQVILLTGEGTIESAVAAMKLGAFDYLQKPFPLKELETLVEKAAEHGRLRRENDRLKLLLKRSEPVGDFIGEAPPMKELFRLIERAGPSEKPILIQGESGTGKELVARALHRRSSRASKPMVVVNCAALPETLLESELFGHERGAFTGAVAAKPGLFEIADEGTLFIDEFGELPGSLQAKLLRVLEDGTFRRIGSIKEQKVNVRLIAATNRDLKKEIDAGRFREDLYYRVNVLTIEMPPLREHPSDIALLVDHFLGRDWEIEDEALRLMERYSWPGNVRQLINAIERAKIMSDHGTIHVNDLSREIREGTSQRLGTAGAAIPSLASNEDDLASVQRAKVVEVLARVQGNKMRAAKQLGIERRKIYRLIEKFGITQEELGLKPNSEP